MSARILVSYAYLNNNPRGLEETRVGVAERGAQLLLDSGAFTAWKSGKSIHIDDYCRFIEKLLFSPWNYFTLDVIGDAAAALKNYNTMLRRGFKPIPIFTRGEDVSVLEEYYSTSDMVSTWNRF